MELALKKYAVLVRKSSKQYIKEGVKLPNEENFRTLEEKETYKYFGILETDTIKQVEIKNKN